MVLDRGQINFIMTERKCNIERSVFTEHQTRCDKGAFGVRGLLLLKHRELRGEKLEGVLRELGGVLRGSLLARRLLLRGFLVQGRLLLDVTVCRDLYVGSNSTI